MRSRRLLALVTVAAVAVAGCGSSDKTSSSSSGKKSSSGNTGGAVAFNVPDVPVKSSAGAGEGKLAVICWAGYCEDGSTDPKVNWVKPFEKATGCQTTAKVANTSDEMITLMRSGQYDGVSASGNASVKLIAGGDVAPIDTKILANWDNLSETVKLQNYNSVEGKMYGAPHGYGANLLMWRTDKVKPAPATQNWAAVFDPSSPFKGKITAYDDPIYIADASLYLKNTKPSLGI